MQMPRIRRGGGGEGRGPGVGNAILLQIDNGLDSLMFDCAD